MIRLLVITLFALLFTTGAEGTEGTTANQVQRPNEIRLRKGLVDEFFLGEDGLLPTFESDPFYKNGIFKETHWHCRDDRNPFQVSLEGHGWPFSQLYNATKLHSEICQDQFYCAVQKSTPYGPTYCVTYLRCLNGYLSDSGCRCKTEKVSCGCQSNSTVCSRGISKFANMLVKGICAPSASNKYISMGVDYCARADYVTSRKHATFQGTQLSYNSGSQNKSCSPRLFNREYFRIYYGSVQKKEYVTTYTAQFHENDLYKWFNPDVIAESPFIHPGTKTFVKGLFQCYGDSDDNSTTLHCGDPVYCTYAGSEYMPDELPCSESSYETFSCRSLCFLNQAHFYTAVVDGCHFVVQEIEHRQEVVIPKLSKADRIMHERYERQAASLKNTSCDSCRASCEDEGLVVLLDSKDYSSVTVCSHPVCQTSDEEKTVHHFLFDEEILLKRANYDITISAANKVIKNFILICPPHSICEHISHPFQYDALLNPKCQPYWFWIIITLFTALLLTLIVVIAAWCEFVCKRFFRICGCLKFLFLFCCSKCRRVRDAAVNIEYKFNKISFNDQNPLLHTNNAYVSDEDDDVIVNYPPKHNSRTISRNFYKIAIIISLYTFTSGVSGQAQVLTVTQDSCIRSGVETSPLCFVEGHAEVSLAPIGQDVLLGIYDQEQNYISNIVLNVQSIEMECQRKSHFATRSHKFQVESFYKCHLTEMCSGDVLTNCSNFPKQSFIQFISTEAFSSVGRSYCERTRCEGSAISCGCFSTVDMCTYFRVYAVPTDADLYSVFSCPSWPYRVIGTVTYTDERGDTRSEQVKIRSGIDTFLEGKPGVKFSIKSISVPPTNLFQYFFISDYFSFMAQEVQYSNPAIGTLSQLVCNNLNAADILDPNDCQIPTHPCICKMSYTEPICECEEINLRTFGKNADSVLPLKIGDGTVMKDDHGILIYKSGASSLLTLSITLSKASFRQFKTSSSCEITPVDLLGCYDCISGAQFNYACVSSSDNVFGVVRCLSGTIFPVLCTTNPVQKYATLHYNSASIAETCTLDCPSGGNKFKFSGVLDYITPVNFSTYSVLKTKFSNVPSENWSDSSFWSSLTKPFSGIASFIFHDWWKILIFALLVFLFITFCFPVVIMPLLGYSVRNVVSSIGTFTMTAFATSGRSIFNKRVRSAYYQEKGYSPLRRERPRRRI
jgi:hypothetical protein